MKKMPSVNVVCIERISEWRFSGHRYLSLHKTKKWRNVFVHMIKTRKIKSGKTMRQIYRYVLSGYDCHCAYNDLPFRKNSKYAAIMIGHDIYIFDVGNGYPSREFLVMYSSTYDNVHHEREKEACGAIDEDDYIYYTGGDDDWGNACDDLDDYE